MSSTSPAGPGRYRWGALSPEHAPAWQVLANALADADRTGEHYEHAEDLVEELAEPGVDPARDTWAVWHGTGGQEAMVGFGQLRVDLTPGHDGRVGCLVMGGVLPQHRGHGLGRRIMDLAEARAAELAESRHPGVTRVARAPGGRDDDDVRRLLDARGYEPVRWFHEMGHSLDDPSAEPAPVAGVELCSPTPALGEATRVTHNAAFRDHWGSAERSSEEWATRWTARHARHDVSTLAVEGDRVLAYVLVSQWVPGQAYVTSVGTAPDARGRGLALAALTRTVRRCAESGDFRVVELDVDADSPTGATRLYDRAGFTVQKTTAICQRELP